jgi:WD40 repeat protein
MDSLQGLVNGFAGLAVVLGLVYCFAGYRIRRFILAVPGYIAGAAILGAIAYLLSQQMWVAVLAGVFAGGPIGASIVLALYNVKVFSIGLLLGAVIDVVLYLITDGQIEPAVLLIIPVATGILALMYDKWVIVAGTAFGGAGLAVGGIAYFAFGGVGPAALFALLEGDPSLLAATLGGWLVLGVAGVIVQYQSLKPRERGDWWGGPGGGSDQRASQSTRQESSAEGRSSSRATPGPPRQIRPQALTGHQGKVHAIIWDPNGRWFATAGIYGDVFIWDPQTGGPLNQLLGCGCGFRGESCLAASPDGSWLAAGSCCGELWVWDTATGRLLAKLDAGAGEIRALAIDPAGTWLASADVGEAMRFWNPLKWEQIHEQDHCVWTLAVDPKGRWLASGDCAGTIRLWDTRDGRRLRQISTKRDVGIGGLTASGDGRWLIARDGTDLDFWMLDEDRADRAALNPRPFQGTPAFNDNNAEMRVGRDCVAVARTQEHNGILQLWKLSNVPELLWQTQFARHRSADPLAASPTGAWIASAADSIDIWDTASGTRLHSFPKPTAYGYATAIRAAPDGKTLAAAYQDGSVALFDVSAGTNRHRMPNHRRSLKALEMGADGSWLAAAGSSGIVYLWDPGTGRQIRPPLKGYRADNHDGIGATAASKEGSWLATVGTRGSEIIIWDVRTGQKRQTIQVPQLYAPKLRLAWTPDGRYLALEGNEIIQWFDSRSGEKLGVDDCKSSVKNEFAALSNWLRCHLILGQAAWPDSQYAAAYPTRNEVTASQGAFSGIAPSSDATWLAAPGGSDGILVRNLRTGESCTTSGPRRVSQFPRVHPNGRWLFSGGLDGIIRRWDMSRLPAKPVCDLAMEALPDDDWVVWTDPEDADGRTASGPTTAPAPSAGSAGTHRLRARTAGHISRWIRFPIGAEPLAGAALQRRPARAGDCRCRAVDPARALASSGSAIVSCAWAPRLRMPLATRYTAAVPSEVWSCASSTPRVRCGPTCTTACRPCTAGTWPRSCG